MHKISLQPTTREGNTQARVSSHYHGTIANTHSKRDREITTHQYVLMCHHHVVVNTMQYCYYYYYYYHHGHLLMSVHLIGIIISIGMIIV